MPSNFCSRRTSAPQMLKARAKNLSCFMLLLGRVGANQTIEPECALVLSNKDEVRLPLSLEQLPSPKAFRDAIDSLSPERRPWRQAIPSTALMAMTGITRPRAMWAVPCLLALPLGVSRWGFELAGRG